MAQQRRKITQRERLLKAIVDVTNRHGYAQANVSAVIGEAGVSRPTFYDYFSDRDEGFRVAVEEVQAELNSAVDAALADSTPDSASADAVTALVAYASAQPARARFLMAESMAGGKEALQVRDRGIVGLAVAIEATERRARGARALPDLDARVIIGAVYRVIVSRLRRGEAAISKLTDELVAWLAMYERPVRERRWRSLSPAAVPRRSSFVPDAPIQRMPNVLPPGRPRISEEEIAENHRMRIFYAVARLADEKGYTATTVAQITKLARVDGRVFYRLFADKQEAFAAAHEFGFQLVMDVTAKAFFSRERWPERSWEAGRALTQLLQEDPLLAHVGFVEAYAVGPRAVQQIEHSHAAFLFFLQEGLLHADPDTLPSQVAMEAIIAGVFEIVYLCARSAGESQIAAMLPYIAHLWLTPFLGVSQADKFIASEQQDDKRLARARTS